MADIESLYWDSQVLFEKGCIALAAVRRFAGEVIPPEEEHSVLEEELTSPAAAVTFALGVNRACDELAKKLEQSGGNFASEADLLKRLARVTDAKANALGAIGEAMWIRDFDGKGIDTLPGDPQLLAQDAVTRARGYIERARTLERNETASPRHW